jgi:hypothetical protein
MADYHWEKIIELPLRDGLKLARENALLMGQSKDEGIIDQSKHILRILTWIERRMCLNPVAYSESTTFRMAYLETEETIADLDYTRMVMNSWLNVAKPPRILMKLFHINEDDYYIPKGHGEDWSKL